MRPPGRHRAGIDAPADDDLDRELPVGGGSFGGPADHEPPLVEVRLGQVRQPRRVRQSREVRFEVVHPAVDDRERLEHAVAPVRREVVDGECGRTGLDLAERRLEELGGRADRKGSTRNETVSGIPRW
ncbi:hypothetical protein GCM10025870_27430 [Agromyces marinus]|uniref:Uncharacterized protein n=1 Tax=Agromyces marinus TaxID=1389020 RepID=A0ABN6YI89_9MICO|nr:hypothetical protein GCM10025870_27430 [Agromyces marinus]